MPDPLVLTVTTADLDELAPATRRVVEPLLDLPVPARRRRAGNLLKRRRRELADKAERLRVNVADLMAEDELGLALTILNAL